VPLLTEAEITAALASLPGWERDGGALRRSFTCQGFIGAMGFVVGVALLAEKANHHPDIDIRWNTVTLVLATHSERGLTAKDTELAAGINALVATA